MFYGYARVSTTSQDYSIQEAALKAAGCSVIRSEKVSGTSTEGREELRTLMAFLRFGDTLVVTRVDRLARSAVDLHNIVAELTARGIHLMATEQPAINTATAEGKMLLGMLAVIAEFETNLRKDRQMEGIAKAKAAGGYSGRPKTIDAKKVQQLAQSGLGATEISNRLKIGRASVYRCLKENAGA